MNIYRIVCCGGVQYVQSMTVLGAADIELFKSCAAEARQASKNRNIRGILNDTITRFNAKTQLGIAVAGSPWIATIEI